MKHGVKKTSKEELLRLAEAKQLAAAEAATTGEGRVRGGLGGGANGLNRCSASVAQQRWGGCEGLKGGAKGVTRVKAVLANWSSKGGARVASGKGESGLKAGYMHNAARAESGSCNSWEPQALALTCGEP